MEFQHAYTSLIIYETPLPAVVFGLFDKRSCATSYEFSTTIDIPGRLIETIGPRIRSV